jgi:hypothetical protein
MLENGYYWVRCKNCDDWEIALYNDENPFVWGFIGYDDFHAHEVIAEVGPKIEQYEKPFNFER